MREKVQKVKTGLFVLLSSPINHLRTPQIDLVTLWRGPTPRLGTTGLNYLTVYKVVQTSSASSSYNSNMLLTH